MSKCFDKVSIHKPVTSRPANSERYLICKSKKHETGAAEKYLFNVNVNINENKDANSDVLEIVPLHIIKDDECFYNYIYESNCSLGVKQIKNLLKIAAFSEDKNLKEDSQTEMRDKCLELWKLPNRVRTRPPVLNPDDTLNEILGLIKEKPEKIHDVQSFKKIVNDTGSSPNSLKSESDLKKFCSIYDWYFQVLASNYENRELRFFIGCGGKRISYLNQGNWKDLDMNSVELPAKTLFYGEIVKECKGEASNQMRNKALHIIDAFVLGGIDISGYSLPERNKKCKMLCTALEKCDVEMTLKCKSLLSMEQFPVTMERLLNRKMKGIGKAWTFNVPNTTDRFHVVGSIIFIKELKGPWIAHISKKSGTKYYFNVKNGRSEYHLLKEAALDALNAYLFSIIWPADCPFSSVFERNEAPVSKKTIVDFITSKKLQ